jgi:hypothetical protein
MSHARKGSKGTRRRKSVPVWGAAGLSLLAGGASATTGGPAADVSTPKTALNHEITLGEEEISDVSLATFYVFDKENARTSKSGVQLAYRGCGRCGGCGGRGCGRGCRGCGGGCGCWGGCGCGCCLSWGGCRFC